MSNPFRKPVFVDQIIVQTDLLQTIRCLDLIKGIIMLIQTLANKITPINKTRTKNHEQQNEGRKGRRKCE